MGAILGLVVLLVAGAMAWQHMRHLSARRGAMQDQQPILYGGDSFHVVSCLEAGEGADLAAELRALRAGAEAAGGRWVYVGEVVVNAGESTQIGPVRWDAVVLAQYPSREAYERFASGPEAKELLGRFSRVYEQGFRRAVAANLLFPQVMLGRRVAQIVRREPSKFPFVPMEGELPFAEAGRVAAELRALGEVSERNAVVVLNLLKHGSAEERAADQEYGRRLLGSMAEGGYGPVHLGAAEAVEGSHDFDDIVLVYYPSGSFFADMITSEFFQGIVGGKQLGDTQSTVTVPMLDRL